MHSFRDIPIGIRSAAVAVAVLAPACEFSDTSVDETALERVVIVDLDGRSWDVTQAVVRYGFDPDGFLFGLGASKFVPFEFPAMAAPADSGYPDPGDDFIVIGVAGADARAYRVDDLVDVEVADDAIGATPIAVVVRPLFPGSSPSVYSRILGADTLTVSASGWVYESQSVLYDLETGSLWYRLNGETRLTCIAGTHFTRTLPPRSFVLEPWADWRVREPASLFMLRRPPSPPIAGGG